MTPETTAPQDATAIQAGVPLIQIVLAGMLRLGDGALDTGRAETSRSTSP